MLLNHLKIAGRNLSKRKGYAALNVFGLTIGMICCLLIFHYVSYERSYDDFHPKANNIVRLRLDNYQKGELAWKSATVYPAIAPHLKKDYPEIENFCRLYDAHLMLHNPSNNARYRETQGYFAEPSFLEMFKLPLIKGNASTALNEPNQMILSDAMAKKYFGQEDPIGKQLIFTSRRNQYPFTVTGVFKEYPTNSHLDIEYLVSWQSFVKALRDGGDTTNVLETSFGWYDFYSYLQLKPGTDWKKFESKLPAFTDRYINSQEWYKTNNNKAALHLIPLTDIHLYSNVNQEAEVNGNGQAVGFLLLVAIFIICIAWVNYINLSTARSVERAREVGVRKVMGAVRTDLIRQFLVESLVLNLIAMTLALGVFYALLPAFDRFTGRDVLTGVALTTRYWWIFVGLFATGTLLSGIYPAFVLSGFRPVIVLKGAFKNTSGGQGLRKGLIVTQFIISVVLIAGTIIVYQQVNYMRKQQLGADINQTLVLRGISTMVDSVYANIYQPFKEELLSQSDIKSVTASSNVMGNEIYWTSGVKRLDKPDQTSVTLYHIGVDYDFVPSYQLKMIAGRNFSKDFSTDETAVLLNERAVKLMGFAKPQDAIGVKLTRGDTMTVVGVVSDFHQEGLQKQIEPIIMLGLPNIRNFYSLKVRTSDVQKTIAGVQRIWSKHFPSNPLEYFFLDETFDGQYKANMLFGKVFGTFAILAILIACFGLMGLSAYNVLQRTKEIGIRKVLGATGQNLWVMLSRDFVKLILIALILSIPLSWYIMHQWLQDFAYRINIRWWVFILAGVLALMIALVTISLQVMKALRENPVKSLRTE
jgi:putative ABC transport system permease protein